MIKLNRKQLLKKSLRFRVLQRKNIIFVNLLTADKSISFTCDVKNIDIELSSMAFSSMCILSKYSINKIEVETDAYFTEITFKNGSFRCAMSDGSVFDIDGNDFDFETITPTIDELRELIFENVENF